MRSNNPADFWKDRIISPLAGELWLDIHGFENKYQVSNMGRIRVLNRQNRGLAEIMVQGIKASRDRYCMIQLYKKNIPYTFTVHRLVAAHWVPNPNNFPEVNHKQGIKTDNRATELEWITHLENIRHAYKVLKVNSGLKSHKSKFTKDDVLNIYASPKTHRELGRLYNVSHSVIGFIKRKQSYLDVVNGTEQT